jgi:hypothetical protein
MVKICCNMYKHVIELPCPSRYKIKKQTLKEKWATLTEEERIPFEKMKSDHMAKQSLMKESITDALSKQKGGNCVRSYASIAKVLPKATFSNPIHCFALIPPLPHVHK